MEIGNQKVNQQCKNEQCVPENQPPKTVRALFDVSYLADKFGVFQLEKIATVDYCRRKGFSEMHSQNICLWKDRKTSVRLACLAGPA